MRIRILAPLFLAALAACSSDSDGTDDAADTTVNDVANDVSDGATDVASEDSAPDEDAAPDGTDDITDDIADDPDSGEPDAGDVAEDTTDDADPDAGPDASDDADDVADADASPDDVTDDADTTADADLDVRPADTGDAWPHTPGVRFRIGVDREPALMTDGSETTLEQGIQGGFHIIGTAIGNGMPEGDLFLVFHAYDWSGRLVAETGSQYLLPRDIVDGDLDAPDLTVFVEPDVNVEEIDAANWVLVGELWQDNGGGDTVHLMSDDIEIIVHCCDYF